MISKKIPLNLYEKEFYIDTLHLFQRGDIEEQQKILNFLNQNKKLDDNELKTKFNDFIEKLKIEQFYNDNIENKVLLNKSDSENLITEFINIFFTEKSRFDKYMGEIYNLDTFTIFINEMFDTDEKLDNKEKVTNYLFKKTEEFKKYFLESTKGKIKGKKASFYLDRVINEKYSRNTRIFSKLKKFKANDSIYENDFSLYLSSLSKQILNKYSENIDNISKTNILNQIIEVSVSSQKFGQLFDDVKKGVINKENKMYQKFISHNSILKASDLNELNELNGKTLETKGSDYFERLYDKLKLVDPTIKTERKRSRGNKKVFDKSKIKKAEINNNLEFRKGLRELIVSVIRESSIQTNIDNYQKPFFFDKLKYPKIPDFAYNKEILDNPMNISIQAKTEKENNINMTILMILLEITENKGRIYQYISEGTRNRIYKFLDKNKVEKDFLQKSLLDIINYELFLDKESESIIKKIESGEKIILKKEIDINNKVDLIDDYYLLIDFVKNISKLNTLLKFSHINQKNAVNKIKIFNPTFENNKYLMKHFPVKTIEEFKNFSKKDIQKISDLNLDVIKYYEEKEIKEKLEEMEKQNNKNELNSLFK